jgi:hypothetical protein
MEDSAHGAGDSEGGAASKRRKVEGETERTVAESGAGARAGGGRDEGTGKSAACLRMREKILAVERDYTHYFALDVGGEPGADQYVYQHFNTLCMVGIAPSSIALAGGRKVTQVDFDVGRGGDKSDAPKPSGKKKKGAMYVALCCACGCVSVSAAVRRSTAPDVLFDSAACGFVRGMVGRFLSETSRLCDLVCDDGTRVKVRCALQGHLLEINSRLQENPDLINTKVQQRIEHTSTSQCCKVRCADVRVLVAVSRRLPKASSPSSSPSVKLKMMSVPALYRPSTISCRSCILISYICYASCVVMLDASGALRVSVRG